MSFCSYVVLGITITVQTLDGFSDVPWVIKWLCWRTLFNIILLLLVFLLPSFSLFLFLQWLAPWPITLHCNLYNSPVPCFFAYCFSFLLCSFCDLLANTWLHHEFLIVKLLYLTRCNQCNNITKSRFFWVSAKSSSWGWCSMRRNMQERFDK